MKNYIKFKYKGKKLKGRKYRKERRYLKSIARVIEKEINYDDFIKCYSDMMLYGHSVIKQ